MILMKETFKLEQDYIELIKLLKLIGWVESGGMAKAVVEDGMVMVDGEVELRKRRKIRVGSQVVFEDNEVEIV